jgi:secreted trypsin-like serine protease
VRQLGVCTERSEVDRTLCSAQMDRSFLRGGLLILIVTMQWWTSACASEGTSRIVGTGKTTASYAAGSYPLITWQTAIEITLGNTQFLCGGSIISPSFVLTAGHCVKDLSSGGTLSDPTTMRVIPGHSRTATSGAKGVLRFWVNPR